ncbi:hypothetical protein ACKKBG_A06710 [Auxenochlorella protothecoides x Auxenochlorella symbiontica]
MCDWNQPTEPRTLGQHLAHRLSQIGVKHFFGVPGDYNLQLLDELVKDKFTEGRWTCNELNAGYAADGYARATGVGAVVVTYTVGGLSVINAVAGAYAENLPVICITGAPNSNDIYSNHLVHHTIARKGSMEQELHCMRQVTCDQVIISQLSDAHEQIDHAISAALHNSKPVYIAVCANLAALHHPSFDASPVPYSITPKRSNPASLEQAVRCAAAFLAGKQKPVAVGGGLLRLAGAEEEFVRLVEAAQYPFAVMAAGKGLVPEDHPQWMGTYWGQISSPFVAEVVESADAALFVGAQFNDYATAGNSLNLQQSRMIKVEPYRVVIAGGKGGQVFGCVRMDDFLCGLAEAITPNDTAHQIFKRLWVPTPVVEPSEEGSPLRTKHLFAHVQTLLDDKTILIAETGDSIFNCQKLKLPRGCTYEWSQQYGSIGWSVGAVLGAAIGGQKDGRRVVACIGDGSFQVTAQDVSTMMRYGQNPIIILVNNGGYTIEVEIHDGPADNNYNIIKNWDYVALFKAMQNKEGQLFATRAKTEKDLEDAIEFAKNEAADSLCLIECIVHRDDCSSELLEWGGRVAAANSRPPQSD